MTVLNGRVVVIYNEGGELMNGWILEKMNYKNFMFTYIIAEAQTHTYKYKVDIWRRRNISVLQSNCMCLCVWEYMCVCVLREIYVSQCVHVCVYVCERDRGWEALCCSDSYQTNRHSNRSRQGMREEKVGPCCHGDAISFQSKRLSPGCCQRSFVPA